MIDKLEHCQREPAWQHHPYHYCQAVLLERYVSSMERVGKVGDVLAESRGTRPDRDLKGAYQEVCAQGTEWVAPELFERHLTSKELKLKKKADNIAGLQLADLIAYPSYKAALHRRKGEPLPESFSGRVADILEAGKYRCSPSGKIEGWGRKWLP